MNDVILHMSAQGGGVVPRAQLPGVLLYHGPEESRYVLRRSLSDHLLFHIVPLEPILRSRLHQFTSCREQISNFTTCTTTFLAGSGAGVS